MTLMLASVTGPDEARVAMAGGADVIDLKDPERGALGAVTPATVRETVAAIAGRRRVSAVTGDLPMVPETVLAAAAAMADAGAEDVKIGLFDGGDTQACLRALATIARRTRLIAVLFADRDPDLSLLPALRAAGFHGAMLDTAGKDGRGLLLHLDLPRLKRFTDACRAERLACGLAGSLEAPDVPRLLVLEPSFLGFRGALCEGGRSGTLALDAVRAIRGLIPQETSGRSGDVDYRLLAARGYAPEAGNETSVTDRVFVTDFILPVCIGVYARERTAPQTMRFDVDVLVRRAAQATQDLRDVFSYDLITDGIKLLVAAGHIGLQETLAEDIAAMLLAHPRVVRVAVRLAKLDTGSGHVGVAIERTRADIAALARGLGATRPGTGGV